MKCVFIGNSPEKIKQTEKAFALTVEHGPKDCYGTSSNNYYMWIAKSLVEVVELSEDSFHYIIPGWLYNKNKREFEAVFEWSLRCIIENKEAV